MPYKQSIKNSNNRYHGLDILRGFAMIVMTLDHAREFLTTGIYADINITSNLYQMTVSLFFTRWIAHLAAPIFMFCSGVGIYFAGQHRNKIQLLELCVTRGLWLILLELTVVQFFWFFDFDIHVYELGVLWAIGWCMILMGIMIYFPKWITFLLSVGLILGHNLTDFITRAHFGSMNGLWDIWNILHISGVLHRGKFYFHVLFPLIPWIGVMALGYVLAPVIVRMDSMKRKRIAIITGISLISGGFLLRFINSYGDPVLWEYSRNIIYNIFSFFNVTKYPPSLLYLLFTLGLAFIFLGWIEGKNNAITKRIAAFGEVPFFFYILHIPLLHLVGIIIAYIMLGHAEWLLVTADLSEQQTPTIAYGYDLLFTYGGWIICLLMLYPMCQWFANFRTQHKTWWVSYL